MFCKAERPNVAWVSCIELFCASSISDVVSHKLVKSLSARPELFLSGQPSSCEFAGFLGDLMGCRDSEALDRASILCQRMLHFVKQYQLYMQSDVLEPMWRTMQDEMSGATNLDTVSTRTSALASLLILSSNCSCRLQGC